MALPLFRARARQSPSRARYYDILIKDRLSSVDCLPKQQTIAQDSILCLLPVGIRKAWFNICRSIFGVH